MDIADAHRTAAAQTKLANSAETLEDSARSQEDSADRRTVLAANRTILAAERTYAAWIRTGLAALASGIGARALLEGVVPGWLIGGTGTVLVLFSGFCFLAAIWRELTPDIDPMPETRRLPAWLLIAVNGFLTLVALAALVGIWIG
ncbi:MULTISPECIES: YidH family protein [unclassified Sphingomonas]|uniref:YidH family protein n=1 Tax=unclassified Sphingomonas TaxID=196159 RepID=UPI0006F69E9F|nr:MULTISPECIES: DUF202 domain-containing protein [unclassified Sphingomonas]KQX19276.1 hypothetical protein ASD17_12065 [Sphingomonas sp. Root1294]KQY65480.1 hypothetical protein ASD39_15265 [Sphingomonas sp. Root50]KRB95222.1 hypothetical protein ASE22_04795 [Sphingomonas sp. Root720]